jgi:hypothetical protein
VFGGATIYFVARNEEFCKFVTGAFRVSGGRTAIGE